jgi:MFS family permease
MNNWRANTRIYYGWWVVSALFFILLNTGGAGFYVFPVFVVPLMEEFGWSVTQISVGAAIWAVVFGLSGPLIGLLIPRIGVCGTMLGAACIASLTCLGYASLQSLWMLYATMFVSGFAIAGSTLVPAQTLITNWFNRYRGRAMSWTMLGIGLGGLLLAPFNEFLIRVLGWRRTWLVAFCITWLIVIPLIAVFVRTKPADMGLLPDGGGAQKDGPSTRSGLLTKRALASLSFWLLFSTYGWPRDSAWQAVYCSGGSPTGGTPQGFWQSPVSCWQPARWSSSCLLSDWVCTTLTLSGCIPFSSDSELPVTQ